MGEFGDFGRSLPMRTSRLAPTYVYVIQRTRPKSCSKLQT